MLEFKLQLFKPQPPSGLFCRKKISEKELGRSSHRVGGGMAGVEAESSPIAALSRSFKSPLNLKGPLQLEALKHGRWHCFRTLGSNMCGTTTTAAAAVAAPAAPPTPSTTTNYSSPLATTATVRIGSTQDRHLRCSRESTQNTLEILREL